MKTIEKKPKVAVVQGEAFRCTAFQDPEGNWRGIFSGVMLPPVIEVLSEIDEREIQSGRYFRL